VNLLRLLFNLVSQVEYTKALSSSPLLSGAENLTKSLQFRIYFGVFDADGVFDAEKRRVPLRNPPRSTPGVACLTPKNAVLDGEKTECLTPKNGVLDAEKRRILYQNPNVKHAPNGVNTAR
jgi:hypothetical protein